MATRDRWSRCWRRLGARPPAALFDALVSCYAEPHRAYHTLEHLRECFEHLDGAAAHAERHVEVELALWFHDAIYDTRALDNEARSALWAYEVLVDAGVSRATARRVSDLILVTKHDGTAQTGDQALLLDIDLAIFGADEARFDAYEQQVRREYAWVEEPEFRATRSGILKSFLERPALYLTQHFGDRFEAEARRNLARSLEKLSS